MPSDALLDRQFLERLERLTLHWEKSFSGLVGGHNRSRFAGGGQEFLDHRHFHHGDDLRAVNWRAYMRLEKLFLKMFQIEPRVPVRLLLDTSGSMAAISEQKFEYARQLAAALSYVALVRLDTISIQPFAETLGDRFVWGGGRHRFSPVMDYLGNLKSGGRSSFHLAVREFISRYPHPGLLIVISDFLDDAGCEKSLQYLADFGHELVLLQVWSDEDRQPPWAGELELVDSETGSRVKMQIDDQARERYTASFDHYAGVLQKIAVRNNGRYLGVAASTALEEVIFGALVRAKGVV
jgi:uncharacterized protein (DUF58 family)